MIALTRSYVHGASDIPLIGDTIGEHFDAVVRRWPDREALVVRHQNIRWTYGDLKERVDAFAAGLVALGLEPGDRIGIWSPNNAEWVITQFATAQAGLILVNINPAYRLAELEYALKKVDCRALITARSFKTSDYLGMLRELAPEIDSCAPGRLRAAKLPSLSTVIVIGEGGRAGHADLRRGRRDGRRTPPRARSRSAAASCSSTIRSTSSSRAARRAFQRARRSPITTF